MQEKEDYEFNFHSAQCSHDRPKQEEKTLSYSFLQEQGWRRRCRSNIAAIFHLLGKPKVALCCVDKHFGYSNFELMGYLYKRFPVKKSIGMILSMTWLKA